MKKTLTIVFILSLIISTVLIFAFSTQSSEMTSDIKDARNHNLLNDEHYPNYKTFETTITLNAIGDILIHNSVYDDARTSNGFDFRPMFEKIKPYLSNANITFANQETMLGGYELGLSSYPRFNSPFEVGDALKDAGVDIVSLANNHTLDRGEQAIINATNHLNSIGIKYVGSFQSEEDRNRARIINKHGVAVGFLAYTYGTNGIPVPEGKDYLVNLIDEEQIISDINELKSLTDCIVVSMHFGQEYQSLPNDEQIYLANLLTDHGADIIIGHHPHVLQPVDWMVSANGETSFVSYSLGNFLSAQVGLERLIGAIMQVELTKTINEYGTTLTVSNAKIMPTYNSYENFRHFKIVPLIDADQYNLPNAKTVFNETENLLTTFTDNVEIVHYLE